MTMAAENYVAKLNEHAQGNRLELRYDDVSSVGPDHIKRFTMRAIVNNVAYPEGEGNNKKEAKQHAAKNALRALFGEQTDCTEDAADASTASVNQTSITSNHFVSWLNEYGNKNKVLIKAVETTTIGPKQASYCCKFLLGDKEYPSGYGNSKKEAKEEAAKLVHHEICGGESTQTRDSGNGSSLSQTQESKPNVTGLSDLTKRLSLKVEGGNFIGLINEHCMRTRSTNEFVKVERRGEAHNPTFFYKVVINGVEYPVAEGRTAKDAKQKAAQLALEAIDEQTAPKNENQSPCVKSKIRYVVYFSAAICDIEEQIQGGEGGTHVLRRIAANFQPDCLKSKEGLMPTFSGEMASEKKGSQASDQSFTSLFDSIELLGKGTFGHVFKARDKLVDKEYAVKIVRWKENVLREVMALSSLEHPNIVQYYTCWKEEAGYQMDGSADSGGASGSAAGKHLYIKMELCDTRTLCEWIKDKNAQSAEESMTDSTRREESLTIVQQIVSGVEFIHSMKFIHRDLKPANILFGRERKVKIGDFGLVTVENDAENPMERTVCKGTPNYMAPEQISSRSYDSKVDIFALGLIYFELLWKLPGEEVKNVIFADVRNQKLPQGFSERFHRECHVIKSMLCFKPEARPEAGKLRKDLEEWSRMFGPPKNVPQDSQTV